MSAGVKSPRLARNGQQATKCATQIIKPQRRAKPRTTATATWIRITGGLKQRQTAQTRLPNAKQPRSRPCDNVNREKTVCGATRQTARSKSKRRTYVCPSGLFPRPRGRFCLLKSSVLASPCCPRAFRRSLCIGAWLLSSTATHSMSCGDTKGANLECEFPMNSDYSSTCVETFVDPAPAC